MKRVRIDYYEDPDVAKYLRDKTIFLQGDKSILIRKATRKIYNDYKRKKVA